MPESCSFFNNTLLLPNDVLLVHSNFARVIKSVLHLHMLLRLAGAACNVRLSRQLARAAQQPSAEHSAKRHNRVAVDVVAVLRVQIKRPVTHALANGPHVVEAGDVHAISRDDLQRASRLHPMIVTGLCRARAARRERNPAATQGQSGHWHTMRKLGVVTARYSTSFPISQARMHQLDDEIIAAVLIAIIIANTGLR